MPRNSSGIYSLPAGNPVQGGTTVESAWANSTMNDLADALTDSLDRTGKGGMTGVLKAVDGTVASPGIQFTAEASSGFYRAGAGDIRFSVLGSDVLAFSDGITVSSSDGGALAGPFVRAFRESGTPAADDLIGAFDLRGNSSLAAERVYGRIQGAIVDPTDASEDGKLVFSTMRAGTLTSAMELTELGALTGLTGITAAGDITTTGEIIVDAATVPKLRLNSGDDSFSDITFGDSGGTVAALRYRHDTDHFQFTNAAGTVRMDVDASTGDVDIVNALRVGTGSTNAGSVLLQTGTFADDVYYYMDSTSFGIRYDSDNSDFYIGTLATPEIFIDASTNNVGINTTDPAADGGYTGLTIDGVDSQIVMRRGGANAGFMFTTATDFALLAGPAVDNFTFGRASSEFARFTSGGNFLVGKTASDTTTEGISVLPTGRINIVEDGAATAFNMIFYRNGTGTAVGSISTTSTATTYNTSSDRRLKDNIGDAGPAGYLIDQIQVRMFDWKADGSHQPHGVIAQELQTVAPYAVTEGEAEDDAWAVDHSKLVPLLIKEIQDLRARVAALEA